MASIATHANRNTRVLFLCTLSAFGVSLLGVMFLSLERMTAAWSGASFSVVENYGNRSEYRYRELVTNRPFPGSPAERGGLRAGLQLLKVNGVSWTDTATLRQIAIGAKPGDRVTYIVKDKLTGQQQSIQIALAKPSTSILLITRLFVDALISLIFLGVGIFIFERKSGDTRAFVFYLVSVAAACGFLVRIQTVVGASSFGPAEALLSWRMASGVVQTALAALLPAFVLHLALIFPKPCFVHLPSRRVLLLSYLTPAVLSAFAAVCLVGVSLFSSKDAAGALPSLPSGVIVLLMALALVYVVGYPLAACTALYLSYQQSDVEEKRQLRWPIWGTMVAVAIQLIPSPSAAPGVFSLGLSMNDALWQRAAQATVWSYVDLQKSLAYLLIPLCFATSILKHRLMDIDVIIRKTTLYTLLTGLLIGLYLILAGGIGGAAVKLAGIKNEWVIVSSSLVIALVFGPLKNLVQQNLDRRFFRRKFDYVTALRDLNRHVMEAPGTARLLAFVAERIQQTLSVRSIVVFVWNPGERTYYAAARVGVPDEINDATSIDLDPASVGIVHVAASPFTHAQREVLRKIYCELLVPAHSDGRVLAWMAVGGKLSDQAFDSDDLEYLVSAGTQLAVGLRQAHVQEQERELERIRREVLAHISDEVNQVNLLKECCRCGTCYDRSAERCLRDGEELTVALPIERILERKYRLDERIGRGGMGAVYQAMDLRLKRTVAVKVLLGRLFGNREVLRRFEREAQTAARLQHPNVVAIYDYGRIGSEGAYLVMERLYGGTWRAELQRKGKLTPSVAAAWFDQLLHGLQAAHDCGVIHRDLKPENVLIVNLPHGNQRVTILDFGIAKWRTAGPDEITSLTAAGEVVGTRGYMAPEQYRGVDAGVQTDVFAVGVMVVESLTGHRPGTGNAESDWDAALTDLGEKHVVTEVKRIVSRCLAADPRERFATVGELREPLIAALRNCRMSPAECTSQEDVDTTPLTAREDNAR